MELGLGTEKGEEMEGEGEERRRARSVARPRRSMGYLSQIDSLVE